MNDPLSQLLATPDGFLHSFEGDEAIIVPMDRTAYARSIFLDRRISPAGEGGWRVPVAELAAAAPPAQPMGWIFHVAHCGSTLLARALDELGAGLVLREPQALRQLGLAANPDLLAPTLALLSRRYEGAGPTLVKANVPVNFLLGEIAAADPQAPALFLHLGLIDYLHAILRSPNHRAWLRNVSGLLAGHLGDLARLQDAELCAALWLAMRRRFASALERMPNGRTLDAEMFFAAPRETLADAAALFGIGAAPDRIDTLVSGPLFSTYSKNPAHAFDNAARLLRRDALAGELADEVMLAERWIKGNAPDLVAVEGAFAAATLAV